MNSRNGIICSVHFTFVDMYACIKLYMNDKVVGVIPRFELTDLLVSLRQQIDEDELVEVPFSFLRIIPETENVNISSEEVVKVEDIAIEDENGGSSNKHVVKVQLNLHELLPGSPNPSSNEVQIKSNEVAGKVIDKTQKTAEEDVWKVAFRFQRPWEVKMIKIYSEEEISRARGMRSTYLKFWNKRVKEVCRKSPSASKKTVCNIVNKEWREEQKAILETEKAILDTSGANSPVGLKPGTLNNNMATINDVSQELKEIEEMLSEPKISKNKEKVQRLIARQQRARSQMKRAQEVMRKNLKAKKAKTD